MNHIILPATVFSVIFFEYEAGSKRGALSFSSNTLTIRFLDELCPPLSVTVTVRLYVGIVSRSKLALVVNTPVFLSTLNVSPVLPAVIRKASELPSLSVAWNFTTFVPMATASLTLTTGEPGSNSGALSLAFSTVMFT